MEGRCVQDLRVEGQSVQCDSQDAGGLTKTDSFHSVYYDPAFSDEQRRQQLFDGQLFVYSPRKSTLAFIAFARKLIEQAFAPLNPETAQHELPLEQYAGILLKLKPWFIHHPESKRLIQDIFRPNGLQPRKNIF